MFDLTVQRLIDQVIDSPVKLHLLLIFHEHPRLEVTPPQMADRACRDIWSVTEALHELAEDGALSLQNSGESYRYAPKADLIEPIRRLLGCYDDPLSRDLIQRAVRESASYASFRRSAVGYERYVAA